ncbi:DNA topoisomerase-1 [Arcticibacter tournemirensis]|uniref:DNA topoisomerase n=1 Tax=Arcticibacter tournemirensis TaxID=699437 RepID=A0A5M9HB49_9SPHI|nr:DNA topoisomerase IB [Arcticibacter tournemirensis]KAA8483569.1 DNA topoisomerase IB [Arcticibacter tournemirensis]TQM51481.1 DNA topoisomerase-1 [Arcticibacter tournemirensis]
MTETEQLLEENNLVYVSDTSPGITRKAARDGFVFLNRRGEEISDERTLARIKRLVLPPAWQNVWIAEKANAHLQATGIDQAGRKQYRYHSSWSELRNENKFYRLLEFGRKLPEFRRNLQRDLRRRSLDQRKVLAIAVNFMQKTLIRVGNESYKQLYGSYGLSTLRDRHVKIEGSRMKLCFRGKKGVMHEMNLTDRNLSKLVKKCRDIPGQELFQYYTPDGERCPIDSGMINSYIKEITGCDFTAKDFRTWSGTMEALRSYSEYEFPESETKRKKITVAVLDSVSSKLGNTRSVCKKYYVFPALMEAYENGSLLPFLKKVKKNGLLAPETGLNADEKVLLSFLKAERNKKSGST